MARLHRIAPPGGFALTPPNAAPCPRAFPDLDKLKQGALEKALAQQIEAIHQEELKRAPLDLKTGLEVRSQERPFADHTADRVVHRRLGRTTVRREKAPSTILRQAGGSGT